MISSVLTARGVPGGTAARTFVDAYLDPGSKRRRNVLFIFFNSLFVFILIEKKTGTTRVSRLHTQTQTKFMHET